MYPAFSAVSGTGAKCRAVVGGFQKDIRTVRNREAVPAIPTRVVEIEAAGAPTTWSRCGSDPTSAPPWPGPILLCEASGTANAAGLDRRTIASTCASRPMPALAFGSSRRTGRIWKYASRALLVFNGIFHALDAAVAGLGSSSCRRTLRSLIWP